MIKKIYIIGTLVLGLLGAFGIAAPERVEVYVDAVSGSDQTGARTKEKPWRSLGFAVERMNPGKSWIALACIHAKLAHDCRRSLGIVQ